MDLVLIEHEVVSEQSHVEDFLSIWLQSSTVQPHSLNRALISHRYNLLWFILERTNDLKELFHIITIHYQRNGNLLSLKFCLSLFILVKQLGHKSWQFVVNIKHDHVDDFIKDPVVLLSLELLVLLFEFQILFGR